MASQYLTDSSLSTDVSQFDFAASVGRYILYVNLPQFNSSLLNITLLYLTDIIRYIFFDTLVHYLASQYLTDSSLNTDVSQFDFAASVGH